MNHRSRYLAPLPRVDRPGRGKRIALRATVLGLLAAPVVAVILIAALRPLPRNSAAYPIYLAHDQFFLPFRGYTYTLFLPNSLVWWSVLALIAGLVLTSFAIDRSFILRSHIWLLRKAVGRPRYHGRLLAAARVFNLFGLHGHDLLLHVVERERELALAALMATSRGDAPNKAGDHLARLSELSTRLILLDSCRGRIDAAWLRAALRWQEALIVLRFHGQSAAQKRLAALAPTLVDPTLAGSLLTQPDAWPDEQDLSADSLLVDLLLSACQVDRSAATRRLNPQIAVLLPGEDEACRRALIEAADRRRTQLTHVRSALEQHVWTPLPGRRSTPMRAERPPSLPSEHAALIGELAAGQAVFAALRPGQTEDAPAASDLPATALAFLDALDVLSLTAELALLDGTDAQTLADEPDDSVQDLAVQAQALVAQAPSPLHYQIAAQLAEGANGRRRNELSGARNLLTGARDPVADLLRDFVTEEDLDLAGARAESLAAAAGPQSENEHEAALPQEYRLTRG